MNQDQRAALLRELLATQTTGQSNWTEERLEPRPNSPDPHLAEIEFSTINKLKPNDERLLVVLRPDGDIQVEYHVAGLRGTPFEALFIASEDETADSIRAVTAFVEDILFERRILTSTTRILAGRVHFLPIAEFAPLERSGVTWARSWRGTHDRSGT